MKKGFNKFYDFIDKIGKPNFIFLVFIIFIILVTGLYQTFSMFTFTDDTSIIDGILTYKFILNNDNTENAITIAANSTKNIMLTISNPESLNLKYGIYYSSSDNLTNVNLGYLSSSSNKATDIIESKKTYTVKLKIENNDHNNITINFGLSYGFEKGGDLLLDSGKHWVGTYSPYKEVMEYLETDGLHYLNTEFYPNQDTKIEFISSLNEIDSADYWFGTSNDDQEIFTLMRTEDNKIESSYGKTTSKLEEITFEKDFQYIVTMSKGNLFINNKQYLAKELENFKAKNPLILFSSGKEIQKESVNLNNIIDIKRAKLKFYSAKIYDNDTLVRDYIPVKDNQNIACLYDKVTEELYYLQA